MAQHDQLDVLDLHGAMAPNEQLQEGDEGEVDEGEEHRAILSEPGWGLPLVKALSSFMGHSSVTITLDRYGHLFPGSEAEAAGLFDEYLARAGGGPCVSAVTGGRVRRDAGRWRALKDRRAAISRSSSVAGVTARPTSGRRDL